MSKIKILADSYSESGQNESVQQRHYLPGKRWLREQARLHNLPGDPQVDAPSRTLARALGCASCAAAPRLPGTIRDRGDPEVQRENLLQRITDPIHGERPAAARSDVGHKGGNCC